MGKGRKFAERFFEGAKFISELVDGETTGWGHEVPRDWIDVVAEDEEEADGESPVCPYCGGDIYYRNGQYFCGSCENYLTKEEIEEANGFTVKPRY